MTRTSGNRLVAIERWWRELDELNRERARYFSATNQRLSREMFCELRDAGVLAVDDQYHLMVEAVQAPTFPMPSDLRTYVQQRPLGRRDVRAS